MSCRTSRSSPQQHVVVETIYKGLQTLKHHGLTNGRVLLFFCGYLSPTTFTPRQAGLQQLHLDGILELSRTLRK